MGDLTEEQLEQVDRLLMLYYARGIAVAVQNLSKVFDECGFTVQVAAKAMQDLVDEAVDIAEKDIAQYGK